MKTEYEVSLEKRLLETRGKLLTANSILEGVVHVCTVVYSEVPLEGTPLWEAINYLEESRRESLGEPHVEL